MGRWHGSRGNVWNHCRGIGQWECGSGKGIRPKRERGMGYPEPEYPTVNIFKTLGGKPGNSAKGVAEHLVQGNNAVERAEKSGALERNV